jgi:hypothetical protein
MIEPSPGFPLPEFAQFKKQQEVEVIARFVVFTKMFMYAHAPVPYQMYPLSILLQEAWTRDFTSFEVKAAGMMKSYPSSTISFTLVSLKNSLHKTFMDLFD